MDSSDLNRSEIHKELQEFGFELDHIELALKMTSNKEEAINL